MTRRGAEAAARTVAGRRGRALVAGLALSLLAGPALAQICDLTLHDAYRGEIKGPSDGGLETNDQFIACFTPAADGYVSLWAQWDAGAPLVRLSPGANYRGPGERAAPVWNGLETCFGTGADGYFLSAPHTQGGSSGQLLLAFTPSEDAQPASADGVDAGALGQPSGAGCDVTLGVAISLSPRAN